MAAFCHPFARQGPVLGRATWESSWLSCGRHRSLGCAIVYADGTSFIRRARVFFEALKQKDYPNASTLAKACGCARNTAQRTISRLEEEYLVPFAYDGSKKGYYLTNPSYDFPAFLPPGKDELTALLLAREIVKQLDAADLRECLDSLWHQFSLHSKAVSRDLEPLTSVFSSDSTTIASIADQGLLRYVTAAGAGECVSLHYKSPWRHKELQSYSGRILRVHLSDGAVYLLFEKSGGQNVVLNAAFVRDFQICTTGAETPAPAKEPEGADHWLEGFGVWSGETPEDLEIEILPPAAEYYASQVWHSEQEDRWDADVLVRRLKGIVAPEIVRRVLSLGRHVRAVRPEELRKAVLDQAMLLVERLG